ncbi:hypothetical protein FPV67DRAFT_1786257 [Lyophyllum atratum]|nr:hypothetical protein FPV67DRAFT_1786257 [Lyophyllum atratum]
MDPKRKLGRPKGSKDKPRLPGAPPRGRPKKNATSDGTLGSCELPTDFDADDEYDFEDLTEEQLQEVCRIEIEAFGSGPATQINKLTPSSASASDHSDGLSRLSGSLEDSTQTQPLAPTSEAFGIRCDHSDTSQQSEPAPPAPPAKEPIPSTPETPGSESGSATTANEHPSRASCEPSTERNPAVNQLNQAAARSQAQLFFSQQKAFDVDGESESDDETEEEEEEERETDTAGVPGGRSASGFASNAWFKQPKSMPNWLFDFFRTVVGPLVFAKDGRRLAKPAIFSQAGHPSTSSTFWIHPPEPVASLSRHQFDLPTLYRPRIYLWLPHFFVAELRCPHCGNVLEKNGAAAPRRITDAEDSFYIVTWKYYCRKNCKATFRGWSPKIMSSLPPYLSLAFPAILSQRGGLSRQVMSQLRVGNQHKMGPSGVRSLLLESHTLRFNVLQAQYLESVFELVSAQQRVSGQVQSSLHEFFTAKNIPSFGDFGDSQNYAGFVPSERYLSRMMNRAIELDEVDANQHTACLAPDQIAIDDSHKVNRHIATVDGVPIFNALWTCMTSRYIRAQTLAFTKAHEERIGPLSGVADSVKLYGFDGPQVAFSDDPVKDKKLLQSAFPCLSKNLTPVAAAYGLKELNLPSTTTVSWLSTSDLTESAISSLMAPLDSSPDEHICVSLDAEWNISRRVGVSIIQIAPHSQPDDIFIIPLHKFGERLPPSLLRLFLSKQVFKVGSAIKGDFTRLKKQFPQLADQASFNVINLKEYCIQRGVISHTESGTLDSLCEKVLESYLPKDDTLRMSEEWETKRLPPELLDYAARDVFASRLIFEKVTEIAPIERPTYDSVPGTPVALLAQGGGEPVAYGTISTTQPKSLGAIRVQTHTRSRVVLDINTVVIPSVAAIYHLLPSPSSMPRTRAGKTKSGAFTLGELQAMSSDSAIFQVVAPVSCLAFDQREVLSQNTVMGGPVAVAVLPSGPSLHIREDEDAFEEEEEDSLHGPELAPVELDMLEAHAQVEKTTGKKRQRDESTSAASGILETLAKIIESPPDANDEVYKLTFDEMLAFKPRFIAERTPRHVPSPSVLVPAIQYVFDKYGHSLDAKTNAPLFNPEAWKKARAVVELARQGYLSDIDGVVMYEKAGVDKHGLQKWKCLRGTNNVEGGPHGDIYRKFGALHAGPRLTTNCLTDHRTWYNLQAFAKHQFDVDWDYHHNLGLINRTSFLLNYLSDVLDGASSYAEWTNGDLYEQTKETFGICPFPESLRLRLGMEPFTDGTASRFKLKSNDDWLRRRQGLALPVLPPTTPEARKYFFSKLREYTSLASASGKGRVNYESFAQEWNHSADGKLRFYVTGEVLATYAKTWEKVNNIRASKELASDNVAAVQQTADVFAAPSHPFPEFLTAGPPTSVQPCEGVVEFESPVNVPTSLSTTLSHSHGPCLPDSHQLYTLPDSFAQETPIPTVEPGPHMPPVIMMPMSRSSSLQQPDATLVHLSEPPDENR